LTPSKAAAAEAAVLEEPSAVAGTEIAPAEFFAQLFVAVDDAAAALHLGFRGIPAAAFAEPFKMRLVEWSVGRRSCRVGRRAVAWDTVPFSKNRTKVPP